MTNPQLFSIAATSSSDIWAVGGYINGHGYSTLVEHWDGTGWTVVPSPSPSSSYLNAVTIISPTDIWAVGTSNGGGLSNSTLAEHWNGTSWSVVPSPSPGTNGNYLGSVTAISASDVWAVGFDSGGSLNGSTLVEHWNGSSWNIVPTPDLSNTSNELNSVTAISPTDVWAVGEYANAQDTLMEHWNGSSWSVVPSPNPNPRYNYIYGVAAITASDIWAVGSGDSNNPLVEHWNGTLWTAIPSPDPGTNPTLNGVAAISSSDIWGSWSL